WIYGPAATDTNGRIERDRAHDCGDMLSPNRIGSTALSCTNPPLTVWSAFITAAEISTATLGRTQCGKDSDPTCPAAGADTVPRPVVSLRDPVSPNPRAMMLRPDIDRVSDPCAPAASGSATTVATTIEAIRIRVFSVLEVLESAVAARTRTELPWIRRK